MKPWEMNFNEGGQEPSLDIAEDVKPWEVDFGQKPKEQKSSGLGDMSSMSLAGALKGTEQTQSPFKLPEPSNEPSLDLISPRQQAGNLGEQDLIKQQAEEARANVENLYNRYSTLGNRILGTMDPEAKAKADKDTKLTIQKTLDEIRAQGIAVDYRNGQLYAYDDKGQEIPIDDVGVLKSMNKSKFEMFGAIVGGAASGIYAAKNAPLPPQGKVVAGIGMGLVGGAVGAYEGARLDGLVNQLGMVTKVDDAVLYDKMRDAGIADIVMAPIGAGVAKTIVGSGKLVKSIYDFVLAGNQKGAVDAMLKHTGIDEYEAKQAVQKLEELVGPLRGMNDSEKILYTLTNTQRGGEAIADAAARLDPLASTRLANQISQRAEGVLNAVDNLGTSNNQYIFTKAMDDYTNEVKTYYSKVKDAPTQATENYRFNLDDLNIQGIIDDIDNGISNPYLKQRFQDTAKMINDSYEGKTFNDLIDLRQAMNDIKYNGPKLKFKEKELLDNVITRIDGEIDNAVRTHIPDADTWLTSWSKAKTEYSAMKQVEQNVMYKALTKPGISEDQVVNIFSKYIKAGDNTFFEVMEKLHPKTQNRIEGSVLNKLVNQHADGVEGSRRVINFPALSEEIKKVNWQNPQTKQLTRTINRMAEVFRNDVHLAAVSGRIQLPRFQSYLTADPVVRLKMEIASNMFNIVKRFMPTQTADTLALANNVAKLLENPISAKSINELKRARPIERRKLRAKLNYEDDLSNLQQMYIQRKQAMQQMFNKDIPPRLVWAASPEKLAKLQNPEARILPSVDDILHVSSQGNIAKNRDAIWDYESQQILNTRASDLVTEFIWRNTQGKSGEAITEAAMKYMDDKRITSLMQRAASKLSKEDFEANAKIVANSIKSEAGILIKRIEKDFGVKMPKSEAEKLVALKYKEIMEKCNG